MKLILDNSHKYDYNVNAVNTVFNFKEDKK